MAADASIGNLPDGVYVRIPLADATLAEAKELVDDPAFFEKTRLPVLFHFPQINFDDYWSLPVGEHAMICVFLNERGLL